MKGRTPDDLPSDPEFWRQTAMMNFDLITVLALHGAVVLALRHPGMKGSTRDVLGRAVAQMEQLLVARGALTPEQVAEAHRVEEEARDRRQKL